MDTLYSFILRGLLTEESLDKAGRKQRAESFLSLEKEIWDRLPFELMDDEIINLSKKMATVYCVLNVFENSVRKFITKRLQEEFKETWWTKGVGENIRKKAESRKEEEEKIKWHSQRGDDFINYIEFGDLTSIIIKNFPLFEPHVQTIEWVKSILSPLEKSRNVIMHSGELGKEDVERIGTLIRDWIKQVGA